MKLIPRDELLIVLYRFVRGNGEEWRGMTFGVWNVDMGLFLPAALKMPVSGSWGESGTWADKGGIISPQHPEATKRLDEKEMFSRELANNVADLSRVATTGQKQNHLNRLVVHPNMVVYPNDVLLWSSRNLSFLDFPSALGEFIMMEYSSWGELFL